MPHLAFSAGMLGALLAASASGAHAQKAFAPYTFQGNTRLVVETVTVSDARGQPVTGLTARDFAITEDGKPQAIAFCRFQAVASAPAMAGEAQEETGNGRQENRKQETGNGDLETGSAERGTGLAPVTTFQIAPETPGHPRYRGRRLIALYFDMASMPVADRLRALAAAQHFVDDKMQSADVVSVLSYEGVGVRVEQDFTGDRDALDAALEELYTKASLAALGMASAGGADSGTAFGQDDAEFNIFHDDRELAALENVIQMLAPLAERKSLVYFASGLRLHDTDNEAQLEATIDAAMKANVNLYPIDAEGLTAGAPLGHASQASPGGAAMYNGSAELTYNLQRQQAQDTLYALGHDTGGKALLDSNNLIAGIVRAQNAIISYYVLGYYTSNPALDGKYRRIRVWLTHEGRSRSDHLRYRAGYYAGKVFAKFTAADKERQLEDALRLPDPITDLTLGAAVNYFQKNSAEYFVPVTVRVPGSELGMGKKSSRGRLTMDFIGEIKDAYGMTITNLRDKVQVSLAGSTAARLADASLEYNTGFTLLPGAYSLKLLARDSITGRIGTYVTQFSIPNLIAVHDRVPISSVVLSRGRVPLAAALFNAGPKQGKNEEAGNPLVSPAGELIPDVNRVFRRGGRMLVFLQAYEGEEKGQERKEEGGENREQRRVLVAYVGFYRNHAEVWETAPSTVRTAPEGRAGAVSIAFTVPMNRLKPGRYICQVTVLDPEAQRANYWRSPIAVLPGTVAAARHLSPIMEGDGPDPSGGVRGARGGFGRAAALSGSAASLPGPVSARSGPHHPRAGFSPAGEQDSGFLPPLL